MGKPFVKVRGNFWQPDLELKFFAKGYGPKAEDRWIRTLDMAVEERPKIVDALFTPVEIQWPIEWLTACEPVPGLTILEKRYRRFLPNDYKGSGLMPCRVNPTNLGVEAGRHEV